jgi:methyl-accepting chemotaxis protein
MTKKHRNRSAGTDRPARSTGSGVVDGRVTEGNEGLPFDFHDILDHIDTSLFVVDAEGNLLHWNRALARLTGDSPAEAERKAEEQGVIGPAFYHDGRRSKTLAEKVVEAPERADQKFDVPRVDGVGYTLYADQSMMKDARGEDRHIEFSAAPLYDDDEFVGVVEMVWDRTEDARKQQQLRNLVSTLQGTMADIQHGDLSARVSVEETEYIDDELLGIVDSLNEMATRLETIVEDVAGEADELKGTVEDVAESSRQITETADEQADTIETVNEEVSQLSATVEEIASTSNEVAETATDADDLAKEVRETAAETETVMSEIADSARDVAGDVEALRERIAEIDEVVEVIRDIAEQTNMLALNASIEAARAGAEGEGFAVVADEVKSLAEESQSRAGEIEDLVDGVKEDTQKTVDNLQETNDRVNDGLQQVASATEDLQEIVAAVERTADGIEQVSAATDDQAASTEEIASMLDDAVEQADEVFEEVESVAAANEEQATQVDEISEVIGRLGGD